MNRLEEVYSKNKGKLICIKYVNGVIDRVTDNKALKLMLEDKTIKFVSKTEYKKYSTNNPKQKESNIEVNPVIEHGLKAKDRKKKK